LRALLFHPVATAPGTVPVATAPGTVPVATAPGAVNRGRLDGVAALADDGASRGREEDVKTRPFGQSQHRVGYGFRRVAFDRRAAAATDGHADPGVKQPQIIIDLGLCGDGRTRVARGILLVDGYRRADADHLVDVGLVHPLQELPGVSRERLDVAPLAF